MHSHVVNTNVAWLSTDPPGAELILTHDADTPASRHFLIAGVDGHEEVEEEIAKLLEARGHTVY
jgi:hypothetical protein